MTRAVVVHLSGYADMIITRTNLGSDPTVDRVSQRGSTFHLIGSPSEFDLSHLKPTLFVTKIVFCT